MPKRIPALSVADMEEAQPRSRNYKMFDGGGLHLLVASTGSKSWRFKYLFNGKEKCISLGTYPELDLGHARSRRDAARALLEKQTDPAA